MRFWRHGATSPGPLIRFWESGAGGCRMGVVVADIDVVIVAPTYGDAVEAAGILEEGCAQYGAGILMRSSHRPASTDPEACHPRVGTVLQGGRMLAVVELVDDVGPSHG